MMDKEPFKCYINESKVVFECYKNGGSVRGVIYAVKRANRGVYMG